MSPRTSPFSRRALAAGVATLALVLAACGDDDDSSSATDPTVVDDVSLVPADSTSTTVKPADQPDVAPPDSIPTELVVTDLKVGTGPAATVGDTVFVDYVGIRSDGGQQFDSSYGREPFPVTLGSGQVIPGWEQGLVGVQVGGQRRLDIPAELAYGDQARGDVIQAGDALTFVVDVRAVVPKPDPAAAPTDVELTASTGATEVTSTDVVVGEGDEAADGDTAIVNILLYRGDNLSPLFNSWENGEPLQVNLAEGQSLPGLLEAVPGMKVGGQRIITMPPAAAFGAEGNPQAGLPANTDLIAVVQLEGLLPGTDG